MIKRISHVAIVVSDFEESLAFWRDALGLEMAHEEQVPSQQATVAFLPTGESGIELVRPTTTDNGAARYLAKRGPGMHHIALEVDDLHTMLTRLKAMGVRFINEDPVPAAASHRAAFIHPDSANGVLVELYETTPS